MIIKKISFITLFWLFLSFCLITCKEDESEIIHRINGLLTYSENDSAIAGAYITLYHRWPAWSNLGTDKYVEVITDSSGFFPVANALISRDSWTYTFGIGSPAARDISSTLYMNNFSLLTLGFAGRAFAARKTLWTEKEYVPPT